MTLVQPDLDELDSRLPGLRKQLDALTWDDREVVGDKAIEAFREAGGVGLLIGPESGGAGLSLSSAVRLQRAIGWVSPSLAVASTMHHFSIATLNALAEQGSGMEKLLLEAIASQRLLMASGFAEGRAGASILSATVTARRDGEDYLVSGSKKPCSLARSMNLLSASARVVDDDGTPGGLVVVLIPADAAGMSVRPFWSASVLRGAQSEEVALESVRVPQTLAVELADKNLDHTQKLGFIWFELLISAAYLGVTTKLVDMCLDRGRGSAVDVSRAACAVESAAMSLAGVGAWFDQSDTADESVLERGLVLALMMRYQVQESIATAVGLAGEILGGGAFINEPRVAYLSLAARALAFHPPSRSVMAEPLVGHLRGAQLVVP
jgi:alkylation response protein AidB-like acyl-CoA dehydrogenase